MQKQLEVTERTDSDDERPTDMPLIVVNPFDVGTATPIRSRGSMKRMVPLGDIPAVEQSISTGSVSGEPELRELHGALQRAGLTVQSLLDMHRGSALPDYQAETASMLRHGV